MENPHELSGIDLVWWPTFLRRDAQPGEQEHRRFTECLNNLARALGEEEE